MLLDPEIRAFLESGCSLALASVDASGQPAATRGWGLSVVSSDAVRVRVLFDGEDTVAYENLAALGLAAVTATAVLTFRAVQLKGRVLEVAPATEADLARAREYAAAFITEVQSFDGTSRTLLERLPPTSYAACVIDVAEWFNQTPGPGAGAPFAGATS